MKRFVIVCVAVMVLGAPVLAQSPGGVLSVYTDPFGGGDCFLIEQLGGINSVYVVHKTGPDAQGARFKVTHNWLATYLQTLYPVIYVVEPDIFGGDWFSYGGCKTPPVVIAQLNFLPLAPTPPCTAEFHLEPDPAAASGQLEVTDCDGNTVLADVDFSWVVINYDISCACHADPPVKAEDSTWSRIKAMYR